MDDYVQEKISIKRWLGEKCIDEDDIFCFEQLEWLLEDFRADIEVEVKFRNRNRKIWR